MLRLFLGIIFFLSSEPCRLYVSPAGDDLSGNGKEDNPWQSLEKAQSAVRELIAGGVSEDVTVYLSAGEYELDTALDFDIRDSAPAGNTITYASKDGVGSAVLKSRSVITNSAGWFYFTNGIWKIAVGTGHDIDTLYEGDLRAVEARYPNVDANRLYPQARTPYLASVTGEVSSVNSNISWITYTDGDFGDMSVAAARHITISPWARSNWHLWTCEIIGTDTDLNRIDFDNLGDQTPIGEFARYFLSGALEYLDARGEFYYDSADGYLYYKPRTLGNPAYKNISVPALKTLVNIAGSNKTSVVRGLKFDGLVFSDTAAIVPALHWWNLGWGKEDHAVIKMQNTSDVRFNKCRIKNSGRHGILVIGQNEAVRIESCLIENTGVSGIVLCNRYSKTPDLLKNCVISNCVVQNVGNLSYDAGCIELMSTESCIVDRCGLYDSPRYGVSLRGDCAADTGSFTSFATSANNIIRNSRIERCMQDSGDGAALHQAGINPLNGPNTNYFENIYIYNTYSVAGQNDPQQVKGVYMDWPLATQNQSFKNIQVDVCEAADVVFHDNPSQFIDNVSWMPGFDTNRMGFSKMQLSADFPTEFGFSRTPSPVFHDIVIDNNDPEFTEYGTSWGDSNLGRRKTFWDRTDAPNSRLYRKAAAGGHSAVWRPDIQNAGYYDVYVWKFQTHEQSTTGVVYSVVSRDGTTDITVNQRMPQLVWERLGTHYFERGTNGYVRLNADTAAMDAAVRADAVRFTAIEPKENALWEEDFEAVCSAGTNLVGQRGWQIWAGESPMVQSNASSGIYIQGVSTDDARAKCSVDVALDQFAVIQLSASIPATTSTNASLNHIGLGSSSANAVGFNVGLHTGGIFVATNGIAMEGFVYGFSDGAQFVPSAGVPYTLKAELNLLTGAAKLFVSTDGLTFRQLAFNGAGTIWELPFDLSQVSGWDAVYVRMGKHADCRIYNMSILN